MKRTDSVIARSARRAAQLALARYPHLYSTVLSSLGRGSAEKRAFLRIVHRGDVVLDVGANEGYFTLLFSDLVGATGAVHAFEPVTPTFERLQKRMHQGLWFKNVTLKLAACGEAAGTVTMLVPDEDWGQAALVRHHSGTWSGAAKIMTYDAPMLRLDDYVAATGTTHIDVIKIDAEGGELGIVRGLLATLPTHRPMLLLELFGEWTRSFGYAPLDVIRLLRSVGYDRVFVVDEIIRPVSRETAALLADAAPVNLLCGMCAVHGGRLDRLA